VYIGPPTDVQDAKREPMMVRFLSLASLLSVISITYAQLNTLAVAAGKRYFGSATDNPELSDAAYIAQLSNTNDFHQLTPVRSIRLQHLLDNIHLLSREIV
jgi:hypothetical protein